jgi:hypothetical protein
MIIPALLVAPTFTVQPVKMALHARLVKTLTPCRPDGVLVSVVWVTTRTAVTVLLVAMVFIVKPARMALHARLVRTTTT